jgi:hypothetical protein
MWQERKGGNIFILMGYNINACGKTEKKRCDELTETWHTHNGGTNHIV